MSAIFGLIHWNKQAVEIQSLTPALSKLEIYGTGEPLIWQGANCIFGAYLSKPEQQILVENNQILLADARLDNRDSLCQEFGILHSERSTISDSQLIFYAYQKWGEACLPRLLGDFAFAIWDIEKQSLFAARDFIGARPFYYFQTAQSFGFASDLGALLRFPNLELELDEDEILNTLASHRPSNYYNPSKTYYRNVYRLAFAQQMTVEAGRVNLQNHWIPQQNPEQNYLSEAEYQEQALELLQEAVAARSREFNKIGAHLSGGIDSSSIAIIAARQERAIGRNLAVYSWSPPLGKNPEPDSEQYRIEAICKQENLTCRYIPFTASTNQDLFGTNGQRLQVEEAIMRHAQNDGLELMLSGWGGDEFISFNSRGYRADLFARAKFGELYKTYRPFSPQVSWFKSLILSFWQDIALPLMPNSLYRLFRASDKIDTSPLDDRGFSAAFLERLRKAQAKAGLERYALRGRFQNQRDLFYRGHLTNRIENWAAAGARHKLVYAYPLLDRRLVEFALNLPDKLYLKAGRGRYLYRQATAHLFPPETLALIAHKGEPRKLGHSFIVYKLLAKQYNYAEVISPEIPWLNHDELRMRVAQVTNSEDFNSFRALFWLNLWKTLQAEIADSKAQVP